MVLLKAAADSVDNGNDAMFFDVSQAISVSCCMRQCCGCTPESVSVIRDRCSNKSVNGFGINDCCAITRIAL